MAINGKKRATEELREQEEVNEAEIGGEDASEESLLSEDTLPAEALDEPAGLVSQLGSLLFVSTRPLDVETLAELTRSKPEEVEEALAELRERLDVHALGFGLFEVGGSWQLRTGPSYARVVQRLIPPKARRLSRAAAETLAVIAYKQPVQRSEIEAIRGVDALPTLRTLLDARLIRIVGREATPGQPALYGTTTTFLEKFGLNDLAELPAVRELVELAEEPGETSTEDGESTEAEFEEDESAADEFGSLDTESPAEQ